MIRPIRVETWGDNLRANGWNSTPQLQMPNVANPAQPDSLNHTLYASPGKAKTNFYLHTKFKQLPKLVSSQQFLLDSLI
ncbi:hypothetical protein GCM10007160_41870 [Litchfieldella qijiaojingensis]|uniref:Uncharacterized protein n=1 Tax=Litchfieldella qijiaojingensis TaxID=980347 RepID=A0ABQ2ZE67_9GAMM|nr:hypothetical protein GCM10007160_41870 [Halomonas qijiaojingensis]